MKKNKPPFQALKLCLMVLLILLSLQPLIPSLFAEEPSPPPSPTPTSFVPPAPPSLFLGFHGGLSSGTLTTPATPKESALFESMNEAMGYFLGVNFEGNLLPSLRWFLDGTLAEQKLQIASEGGYATGFWVYEQSGYISHDLGPFSTDVYLFIRSTGFRIGGKYFFSQTSAFKPWVGLGFGFYKWSFQFTNSSKDKSYGEATGMSSGLTYLLGVNLELDLKNIIVIYADLTSPVAHPKFENLFRSNWTWDNVSGNPIIGPYRLGIAVQFGM